MSSQNFSMKSYMRGALLLTLAALIVKVLSAIYRVPFQNMVGDQGFYVYQQVYPFVAIFVTWTAGGVAVAVSKMLANLSIENERERAERKAILQVVYRYLTILSMVFFIGLFFGAPFFAQLMKDEQLILPLRIGSIVTLFMPVLAILKGSFQSRGLLQPIAYSQVFEQTVRVSIILIGTVIIMGTSGSIYSAGTMAIAGTIFGEMACILLLGYYVHKENTFSLKTKVKVKAWPIIKEITLFSLSVSMSSLLLLAFQLVDSFTVFRLLLSTGITYENAQILKGVYDRGQPLVQLGLVIATSMALAIVPLITFKLAKKTGRGAQPFIRLTYKASLVFAVAAAIGLVLVMPYVNTALFKTEALSDVLAIYSLQIIPLSLIITLTAILQGYNKLFIPAIWIITSVGVKLVGNIILTPLYELHGVALTSLISLCICAAALIVYVRKETATHLANKQFYVYLIVAVGAMIVDVKFTEWVLSLFITNSLDNRFTTLCISMVLVIVGACTYMTIVAKLRILKEKEWFVIPLGRRMAAYQLWLNKKRK